MDTVIRVAVVYVFLVAGLRILGKREFAQLSTSELIMLLITSELVSPALTRNEPSLVNSLVAVSALFVLVFATSIFTYRARAVQGLVSAPPVVLVHGGRLVVENLAKERITPEDVLSEAQKAGLLTISEVQWAILQGDGRIAIIGPGREIGSGDAGSEGAAP